MATATQTDVLRQPQTFWPEPKRSWWGFASQPLGPPAHVLVLATREALPRA